VSIRSATTDDAQAIHDLHTASVTELCTLYSEQIIAGLLRGRTPQGYVGMRGVKCMSTQNRVKY